MKTIKDFAKKLTEIIDDDCRLYEYKFCIGNRFEPNMKRNEFIINIETGSSFYFHHEFKNSVMMYRTIEELYVENFYLKKSSEYNIQFCKLFDKVKLVLDRNDKINNFLYA